MDSIYSRKRMRLPKIVYQKIGKKEPRKVKKIITFSSIILIMVITINVAINAINPILNDLCKDKAKSVATIICNQESTKIIENYKYEDLVTIYKDKNENITMIKSNITPINFIISDVAEKVQNRIDKLGEEEVGIRLGSFTGSKILSGRGPIIPIKLSVIGNVETDLRSEFKEQGINQTIHRIYLQVDCNISILTPYDTKTESISNQVLIAENIIVGQIPNAYYNLEGMDSKNVTDIIE